MLLNRLNGKCRVKKGKSAVWGFFKVLLWTAVLAGLALSIVLNFNFYEKLKSRDQKLKAEGVWSKCLLSAEQNEYETAIKTADKIIKEFPVLARKEGVGFYKDQWGRKLAARQGWRRVKQSADGGKYEEALSLAKAFFDKYPDCEFVADAKRQSTQWENKISVGKRIKELLGKAEEARSDNAKLIEQIETMAARYENENNWESAGIVWEMLVGLDGDQRWAEARGRECFHNSYLLKAQGAELGEDMEGAVEFYEKALSYKNDASIDAKAAKLRELIKKQHDVQQSQKDMKEWMAFGENASKSGDHASTLWWYGKAAEAGNSKAMYELSAEYFKGDGVKKDYEKAMNWLLKAADKGRSEAMFDLGGVYYDGIGIEQDYTEAMRWFLKAAAAGRTEAMFNLGHMYYKGLSVDKNVDKSLWWYGKAADKGDHKAASRLALIYFGQGDYQDYSKAARWSKEAAENGEVGAMFNLAVIYHEGKGITEDAGKAAYWFDKAAKAGDMEAMFNLGLLYYQGDGVGVDYVRAAECYTTAAQAGNTKAMLNLGLMYDSGHGVTRNRSQALEWYKKAAGNGNVEAMFHVGQSCYEGFGIEQDYKKAFEWYMKAAKAGNGKSMFYVAWAYANKEGVEQDYSEAIKWYEKSAENNQPEAMHQLGEAYQNGHGVKKDKDKAIDWYRKAARLGCEPAKEVLVKLGHAW